MRTTQIAFALLSILFSSTGILAQTNEAAANPNSTVAFAYVGQNTTPNKIDAFAIRRNGSLESVSGSPFSGAAQELVVSSGFVFGTDLNNIVTYTRSANGALRATSSINGVAHNDTPVGSGVGALTLDRSGSSLYAGEINFQGADNDAYAEFALEHNGALKFLTNTDINVDFNSSLHFSGNNQFAYGLGCFFISWDIFAFHRLPDGTLKSFDPGTTFPPNPTGDFLCPSDMGASAKGILAVTFGIASDGSKQNIITYRITSTGGLEELTHSVIPTNFTGIGAVRFDPTGEFLVVAGDNGVETFRLNANGTLTRIGNVVEPNTGFVDAHWDGAGHVIAISNAALYVFTLRHNGLVLTGTPRPITKAFSLAVLPVR